ncbi:MAG: DUF547 domain-containing protein [Ferruginibacter sp.]
MKKIFTILFSAVVLAGCTSAQNNISKAPTHEKWTALLQKYVNSAGMVNYKGMKTDAAKLNEYLAILSKQKPGKNWSKNEVLAFWINAYNAFTVKLITDNYPVKSIKDLNPAVSVIFVNTVWDKNFFSIGGDKMSLNDIEHRRLRKMEEPRIHFTIVCASISCPKLQNSAYEANELDNQLNNAAKNFLMDNSKNQVSTNSPKLSKIFDWFGGDFKVGGHSKIDFINQYAPVKIDKNADISYLDYNWNLNEQ